MIPSHMPMAMPHMGAAGQDMELAMLRNTVGHLERRLELVEQMLRTVMRQHEVLLTPDTGAGVRKPQPGRPEPPVPSPLPSPSPMPAPPPPPPGRNAAI